MVKLKVVKVGNEWGVGKVGTTNQYYPSYGTGTKAEMEIVAMKHNISYYYYKARGIYEELGKIDRNMMSIQEQLRLEIVYVKK